MKPHVLVVDDSLTVRMDLRGALSVAGFEVTLCETKSSAEMMLEQRQFDAVVLDVVLPDGDGLTLLEQIRKNEQTAQCPVILLSTEAEVRHRVRGVVMGADEYVGKPYDVYYLIRRIRALCNRYSLAPMSRAGSYRILAVDDSPTFLAHLVRHLREDAHDIVLARSGDAALKLLAAQPIDCVILDLHMPAPDGLETLQRIRQTARYDSVPILMLTISENPNDERICRDAGADDYVLKYVPFEQIRARIRGLVRRQRDDALPVETQRSFVPKSSTVRAKAVILPDDAPVSSYEQPSVPSAELPTALPPKARAIPEEQEDFCPLFLAVLVTMGLSNDTARNGLARLPMRLNIDPHRMTSEDLSHALPMLHDTLSMFLSAEEAERRHRALAYMITRSSRRMPSSG